MSFIFFYITNIEYSSLHLTTLRYRFVSFVHLSLPFFHPSFRLRFTRSSIIHAKRILRHHSATFAPAQDTLHSSSSPNCLVSIAFPSVSNSNSTKIKDLIFLVLNHFVLSSLVSVALPSFSTSPNILVPPLTFLFVNSRCVLWIIISSS